MPPTKHVPKPRLHPALNYITLFVWKLLLNWSLLKDLFSPCGSWALVYTCMKSFLISWSDIFLYYGTPLGHKKERERENKLSFFPPAMDFLTASLSPQQDCTKAQQETLVWVPFHAGVDTLPLVSVFFYSTYKNHCTRNVLLHCINGRTVVIVYRIIGYFLNKEA